jgi:hypothetical protein
VEGKANSREVEGGKCHSSTNRFVWRWRYQNQNSNTGGLAASMDGNRKPVGGSQWSVHSSQFLVFNCQWSVVHRHSRPSGRILFADLMIDTRSERGDQALARHAVIMMIKNIFHFSFFIFHFSSFIFHLSAPTPTPTSRAQLRTR